MIVLVAAAFAVDQPDLAIVGLDATPGTEQAALDRAARGIAAAVQSEGGVIAVYDVDLAGRLGVGAEDSLASARDALSEGRRLLQEGDGDLAIAFLEQAAAAHEEAGSDLVRRGEAADAHYALGRAYLKTYDRDRARAEFRRTIVLVPDYMETRADAMNAEIQGLVSEVTAALAERPPRKLSTEGVTSLITKLGVDCLAHGSVDSSGALALSVSSGTDVRYVVRRPGPFEPPAVGSEWYDDIADQLVAACRGEAVPEWTPPIETVGALDPDPIRNPPPRTRKGTAVAASLITVGILGAAGGGAALYLWPDAGTTAPSFTVTVALPQ